MYISNLGKRTTHWHNSFQVQQMAGDAAPSRGNDRAQAFPPTSHRTSHRLPLSIHKQSTKQELGHFAGKRIPGQLSQFSTIFDVQRKKKSPAKCKYLHCSTESTHFDSLDSLVTALSEQPYPLWRPQTLVQQLLLENKAARHCFVEDVFQLTS